MVLNQCFLFCIKYVRGVIISILKIRLDELRENIKRYKLEMKKGQKFCAVVKADAYGLGSKIISKEIDDIVDYFAVSSADEFFSINKIVSRPILLLDPIYKNITKLAKSGCEFCLSNFTQLNKIIYYAKKNNLVKFKLHIAVNTGMNRFGFNTKKEIIKCFNLIKKTQNISIIGIFSHFYAGNDRYFADLQSKRFLEYWQFLIQDKLDRNLIFHIANTSGFENQKCFEMVRIGIGMFLNNNNTIFSLESKIIEMQKLKAGDCVGYGRGFIASKTTTVAVVAIGYADGVFRKIAGHGFVLVCGKFCKVLAVCMDSLIIDVTGVNICIGDKVTLIGENSGSKIFICDFASWCDTIEYEIMTSISSRVKRVYLGGTTNANNNRQISSKKT